MDEKEKGGVGRRKEKEEKPKKGSQYIFYTHPFASNLNL